MTPDSQQGTRKAQSKFVYGLSGLLLVAAVASLVLVHQSNAPSVVLEAKLSELEQVGGRMVLKTTQEPFSGIVLDLRPDGSLLSRSEMKDGKLHGLSEGYYTNLQTQVRESFESGVSHGIRTTWYPNGSTQSVAHIEHGTFQGPFLKFHENGQPSEEVHMVGGQPDGRAVSWYANGQLKSRVQLKAGEVVSSEFFEEKVEAGLDGPLKKTEN